MASKLRDYRLMRLSTDQQAAFDNLYRTGVDCPDSADPLIRYVRDRRIRVAIKSLQRILSDSLSTWSCLVVCGGSGADGTLLANLGLADVTVSDVSEVALRLSRERDRRLKTMMLDAETMDLPANSFDLVLVQDGLHHLPRPVLGFTEMLRVARRAVVIIEPHAGIIGKALGQTWERTGDAVNYVFRWDAGLLTQTTRSYLLDQAAIYPSRIWNHNITLENVGRAVGGGRLGVGVAKALYALLNTPGPRWIGNTMIGIVVKRVQSTVGPQISARLGHGHTTEPRGSPADNATPG